MLKEHDPSAEPARVKAERNWTNADVIKQLKAERAKPKLVDPNAPPEIADVVVNEGRRVGRVNRFETKFKRELRAMMEGYARNNLALFLYASIENRRRKLLTEKLRRLKHAQQKGNMEEGGIAGKSKPKDLFA